MSNKRLWILARDQQGEVSYAIVDPKSGWLPAVGQPVLESGLVGYDRELPYPEDCTVVAILSEKACEFIEIVHRLCQIKGDYDAGILYPFNDFITEVINLPRQ